MLTARIASAVPIFVFGAAHVFAQSSVASDDFNAPALDPVWRFVDPVGDCAAGVQGFATPDAQLRIDVAAGPSHNLWFNDNSAPRVLQSANDTDFQLEVKFDSVVERRFQFQGIIVQETVDHFLRFETYHDGTSARILAAEVDAPVRARTRVDVAAAAAPGWIRVQRTGDVWTLSTSVDGIAFVEATTFTYPLAVTEVGIHAGNFFEAGPDTSPEFVALADYFQNGDLPILDEDGPVDTEPPVADAGAPISAHVGETVELDGTSSADDSTAPADLAFSWNLISAPAGSVWLDGFASADADDDPRDYEGPRASTPSGCAAALAGADTAAPSLTPDLEGDYVVQLVVSDSYALSDPVTITVSALDAIDLAIIEVHEAACVVRQASWCSFRRWYFRPIIDWQLRVAAWELRYGYESSARARLQWLLSRTDGCPERGAVDGWWCSGFRIDWITDCALQSAVYDLVTSALNAID